ncbi:ABC transporter ATP-binding protein [Xylanivirga thermophila]|uniref:ABC transporter ATP-binding protein n=1 Tax=Xylanivirga thermophila TaxID=2496273 RepID=UPI001A936D2F|nr:ABC transporter ATP-binding protein [Xylanivirga thermophila]
MYILKRIFGLMAKYRKRTAGAVALLIIVMSTRLVTPYLTKIIADDVIKDGKVEILPKVLWLLIILSIVRGVLIYARSYLFEDISQNLVFDLRHQLFAHLQELPYKFYDENRIGEIMSRMTGDIDGIRNFVAGGAITLLENLIYFVGALCILFAMNVKLTLIVIITTPILAFVARKFDKMIRPAFDEIREQNAVLNTRTQENISGVRVVKAFAREEYEKDAFSRENIKQLDKNINATFIWSKYIPFMDFISSLSPVVLLGFGGSMVVKGEISLGTLLAFTGYIWMITGPMRMVGWLINMLEQAISSGEKIFYYLDLGSSIKEKPNAVFPEEFHGHVRFENVSFKYKDDEVLHNIEIDAPPGKTIAIMGPTGSGKTSIINLIGRFYDCSQGRITVDGIDVRDYKLKNLRREIGYVMQETFLFSDTIKANIAFGRPDASFDEIIKAAKIAEAHEFIMEMPDGYDTVVGERGTGLSGGQKQRIAIARAILKNPKILILDDSTSSVDMETEFNIQRELEKNMKGKTTFIIAHRISSVKNADEIIILDQGSIVERGTHDELLAKKGRYYGMYKDQYKDFEQLNYKEQVI